MNLRAVWATLKPVHSNPVVQRSNSRQVIYLINENYYYYYSCEQSWREGPFIRELTTHLSDFFTFALQLFSADI